MFMTCNDYNDSSYKSFPHNARFDKYSHPLEVVSRYRDPQLQVGEYNGVYKLVRPSTEQNHSRAWTQVKVHF